MDRNSFARSLGSPPKADDIADVQRWMRAVHQILVAGEGFKGGDSSPDRYIKARDLTESGVKNLAKYGFGYSGATVETIISTGGTTELPPYTPPSAPTNLVVGGGVNHIFLEWEHPPTYNIYLSHFEIWRASSDSLGAAVLVGQTNSTIYSDNVGAGSPIYYYWVRAVSEKDDYSPFNATNGTQGRTALDPAYVLSVLNGRISSSELNTNLNSSLAEIPANTVAINNEITTRQTETGELYGSYTIKMELENPADPNSRRYVAGFGQSVEIIDGLPVSNFIIKAENFAVGKPGHNDFGLTYGTVDGIATVGIGTAHILDATITNAKITEVYADKLKTAEANLTEALIGEGEITNALIGDVIQSTTFEAGVTGWRIDKSGFIICENLLAKGNIVANHLAADSGEIAKTFHIARQAVTFPVAATSDPYQYRGRIDSTGGIEGWLPVISVAFRATGQDIGGGFVSDYTPVHGLFNFRYSIYSKYLFPGSTANRMDIYARVTKTIIGGPTTLVRQVSRIGWWDFGTAHGNFIVSAGVLNPGYSQHQCSLSFVDNNTHSGDIRYTLDVGCVHDAAGVGFETSFWDSDRSALVLEVKR